MIALASGLIMNMLGGRKEWAAQQEAAEDPGRVPRKQVEVVSDQGLAIPWRWSRNGLLTVCMGSMGSQEPRMIPRCLSRVTGKL